MESGLSEVRKLDKTFVRRMRFLPSKMRRKYSRPIRQQIKLLHNSLYNKEKHNTTSLPPNLTNGDESDGNFKEFDESFVERHSRVTQSSIIIQTDVNASNRESQDLQPLASRPTPSSAPAAKKSKTTATAKSKTPLNVPSIQRFLVEPGQDDSMAVPSTSTAADVETEKCAECGKNIPITELFEHMDYHAAKKLHDELRRSEMANRTINYVDNRESQDLQPSTLNNIELEYDFATETNPADVTLQPELIAPEVNPVNQKSIKPRPHKCNEEKCKKTFTSENKLQIHQRNYHSEKCQTCDSGFKSRGDLVQHVQARHYQSECKHVYERSSTNQSIFCQLCKKSIHNIKEYIYVFDGTDLQRVAVKLEESVEVEE